MTDKEEPTVLDSCPKCGWTLYLSPFYQVTEIKMERELKCSSSTCDFKGKEEWVLNKGYKRVPIENRDLEKGDLVRIKSSKVSYDEVSCESCRGSKFKVVDKTGFNCLVLSPLDCPCHPPSKHWFVLEKNVSRTI